MVDELVAWSPSPALGGHVVRCCGYAHQAPGPARQREPLLTGAVLIVGFDPAG